MRPLTQPRQLELRLRYQHVSARASRFNVISGKPGPFYRGNGVTSFSAQAGQCQGTARSAVVYRGMTRRHEAAAILADTCFQIPDSHPLTDLYGFRCV